MLDGMSKAFIASVSVAGLLLCAAFAQADTEPTEAHYRVTFSATWSAETHPSNFPSNRHFSGLVGATHHGDVRIWQTGEAASDGIELMAETGGKGTLLHEIEHLIEDGEAHGELSGGGLSTSPAAVSLEFDAVSTHPYVTLVSMLAPSPDWFVGVSALPLMEDGAWRKRVEVNLRLYDAGTDDGTVPPRQPREKPCPGLSAATAVACVLQTTIWKGRAPRARRRPWSSCHRRLGAATLKTVTAGSMRWPAESSG